MAVQAKDIPAPAVVRRTRKLTFIERLTPRWGREAAWWIEDEAAASGAWFAASGVMTLIVIGIGVVLLFGDGYATIQGIRYALRGFGFTEVRVDGIPAAPWWTIQVVNVIIQVFFKHLKGLTVLWTPSYIFNAVTTGVFVGIGLSNLLDVGFGFGAGFWPSGVTIICGSIGALLGHFLALGAEQVTMTGFCMLGALITALRKR